MTCHIIEYTVLTHEFHSQLIFDNPFRVLAYAIMDSPDSTRCIMGEF